MIFFQTIHQIRTYSETRIVRNENLPLSTIKKGNKFWKKVEDINGKSLMTVHYKFRSVQSTPNWKNPFIQKKYFSSYSTTWQSVDKDLRERGTHAELKKVEEKSVGKESKAEAPDPLNYLRQFDNLCCVEPYRRSVLEALDLKTNPNDLVLDVGCGIGGITHASISEYLHGALGHLTGVDISHQLLNEAQRVNSKKINVSYELASAYQLPFKSQTFNATMCDRLFQHIQRPMDAIQEMIRVTQPDGIIIVADTDWRTFQIDVTGAGATPLSYTSGPYDSHCEAGKRWGTSQRPPKHLQFDMGVMTQRILNHVIPTLTTHSYMGLSLPRLFRASNLENIELQIIPLVLQGRHDLETVVPITYMAQCAVQNSNGIVSERDIQLWMERLDWEDPMHLFGTLNMYICRGIKSLPNQNIVGYNFRKRRSYGTKISNKVNDNSKHSNLKEMNKRKQTKHFFCRLADPVHDHDLIQQAEALINNEYAESDTGITLSSRRLDPGDALELAKNKELIIAVDEQTEQEVLGTIQIQVKSSNDEQNKNSDERTTLRNKGLPNLSNNDPNDLIAEFTCFAVKSDKNYTVHNVNSINVKVEMQSGENDHQRIASSARGRGVGGTLVRYAEAHCQSLGCKIMQLAILCPDVPQEDEPSYKKWLRKYYLKLGYEYHSTIGLDFIKDKNGIVIRDEVHEMYASLRQITKCKAILFQKKL